MFPRIQRIISVLILLAPIVFLCWQGQMQDVPRAIAFEAVAVFVLFLVVYVAKPWFLYPVIIAIGTALWIAGFDKTHWPVDLVIVFVALGLTVVLLPGVGVAKSEKLTHPVGLVATVWYFFVAWMLGSFVLWWFHPDPMLTAAVKNPARKPSERHVGITLSGGGFRAAVFHAGVLKELNELNIPLRGMTTVSGGSIIGAFYCAGGSPDEFVKQIEGDYFNFPRELVCGQNLCRVVLSTPLYGTHFQVLKTDYSRNDVQGYLLERALFGQITMAQLADQWPALMICTTNLTTGDLVGFSSRGVLYRPLHTVASDLPFVNVPASETSSRMPRYVLAAGSSVASYKIAEIVASSGAFPGAVNARTLLLPDHAEGGSDYKRRMQLADGGLTDNLGLRLMLDAARYLPGPSQNNPWNNDHTIVSDGGAAFVETPDVQGLDQLTRAIDIIYANAGAARMDAADLKAQTSLLLISPSLLVQTKLRTETGEIQVAPQEVLFPLSGTFDSTSHAPGNKCLLQIANDPHALKQLAAILPEPQQTRAQSLISDYFKYYSPPDPESARIMHDEHPLKQLHRMLRQDMAVCLTEFYNLSTLSTTVDPIKAERVFRLGRYLVRLNEDELLDWAGAAEKKQPSHP